MSSLSFFPWLKQGVGSFAGRRDDGTIPSNPSQFAARTIVRTRLSLSAGGPNPTTIDVDLPLIGPADIAGFEAKAISRTWPKADATDAEIDRFAIVEFSDPDLPWRYTPAVALGNDGTALDRLKPWAVLLVLKSSEFELVPPSVGEAGTPRLERLVVAANVVLPDLGLSRFWAHVQSEGDWTSGTGFDQSLNSEPQRHSSRIVCPRKLEARESYIAALVPAFELGRLAGLGLPITNGEIPIADVMQPAWQGGTRTVPLEIPVYFSFRFTAGSVGSFKDLATQLVPRVLSTSSFRAMDITAPGAPLNNDPGRGTVPVQGALRPVGSTLPAWNNGFVAEITPIINAPANAIDNGQGAVSEVLAPPLYGQWHAGSPRVVSGVYPWFSSLNTEPHSRVAAAIGTTVVQNDDQALMASAWDQVGDLKDLNQDLRQGQLSRESSVSLYNRRILSETLTDRLLGLSASVHGQVKLPSGSTVAAAIEASPIPKGYFDPQFLRISRSRGAIAAVQSDVGAIPPPSDDILAALNSGAFSPAPAIPAESGAASIEEAGRTAIKACITPEILAILDDLSQSDLLFWGIATFQAGRLQGQHGRSWFVARSLMSLGLLIVEAAASSEGVDLLRRNVQISTGLPSASDIATAPSINGFTVQDPLPANAYDQPPPTTGTTDNPTLQSFRSALQNLLTRLQAMRVPGPVSTPVNLGAIRARMLEALHPAEAIQSSVRKRLTAAPIGWSPNDPLQPIQAAPEFPQPMYEPLRDLSSEWVLPGVSNLPSDTVTIVETNRPFVEAYMAGVNHEMARELLWNEYPTDQRGTYFRQFWDVRGFEPPSGFDPNHLRDIIPIHQWQLQLGQHSARNPSENLVLLLRGLIVNRYPNLIVYLTKRQNGVLLGGDVERYPIFSGRLGSDTAFFGFDLLPSDIINDGNYYIVLQEPQSEPHFGFNLNPNPPVFGSGGFADETTFSQVVTGADFAATTLRRPSRVAIPAASMLTPQ
jgi:hypothetical protein